MKSDDLVGMRFGKLLVLKRNYDKQEKEVKKGKRSIIYWECKCDCGNTTIVASQSLKSKHTSSCGCLRKIKKNVSNTDKVFKFVNTSNNLEGKNFGDLTVIKRDYDKEKTLWDEGKEQRVQWLCLCKCGNTSIVSDHCLLTGNTTSCGCKKRERILLINKNKRKSSKWIEENSLAYCKIKDNVIMVDIEDLNKVNGYCWATKRNKHGDNTYAIRTKTVKNFNDETNLILMHRLILEKELSKYNNNDNIVIDHINGNGLDNRKENLRICTQANNTKNRIISTNNTSGYTGVSFNKSNNRWIARINVNNKRILLGCFLTFKEAVIIRYNAEIKYYGEFNGELRRQDFNKVMKQIEQKENNV